VDDAAHALNYGTRAGGKIGGTRNVMASGEPTLRDSGPFMKRPEREIFDVSEASSGSGEQASVTRERSGICSD
jgi:hypothetical protein